MSEPELSIVLPAYEEAQSLSQVLPVLKEVAAELTPDSEIIVVDTMQPRDETPAVCEKLGVTYMPRRGGDLYGDAVRTGFATARGRFVIMMDGDGSHNPRTLPALWEQRTRSRSGHCIPLCQRRPDRKSPGPDSHESDR